MAAGVILLGMLVATPPSWSASATSVEVWRPPAGAGLASSLQSGAATAVLPIAMPATAPAGVRIRQYGGDLFERIHRSDVLLALGSVASVQQRQIRIWNAYTATPQTLTAVNAVAADGIVTTAPAALPITFAPLQELTWTLSITPDGPATVDATLTWVFTGQPDLPVRITGTRLVAWTWTPDWADGVQERLSWRTDVLPAPYSGVEQRRALRALPRRALEFGVPVQGRARTMLDAALSDWSSREFGLPIWHDVEHLSAPVAAGAVSLPSVTAGRDYAIGALAILIADEVTYEVVEISGIAPAALTLARPLLADWPAGSALYPLRRARLAQYARLARSSDAGARTRVALDITEACDWSTVLTLPVYRGRPVLEQRIEESTDPAQDYQRIASTLDNGAGIVTVDDTAGVPVLLQSHRWQVAGRTAAADLRSLLYALRGQQATLWAPTWSSDLTTVATIGASDINIDVQWTGYTRHLHAQGGRRDLRIELASGSVFYRRITGSSEISGTTERISLDASLGVIATPAQVARISYMALCRLASDDVELEHVTDADGVTLAGVTLRSTQDDV